MTPGPGTYRVYTEFGKTDTNPYSTLPRSPPERKYEVRPKSSIINSRVLNSVNMERRDANFADINPK